MPHISRRGFLGSIASVAPGIAAGASTPVAAAQLSDSAGPATAAPAGRIPHEVEEHRCLIVGSSFGGGVTSLRLAQAGVPVVVLERGRRWPTGPNADTFPSATGPDERARWFRSAPEVFGRPVDVPRFTGLLEASVGENMTLVCATGVGGGSLIYQGMALQPTEELFSDWFPGAIDWREMDRQFYPRVSYAPAGRGPRRADRRAGVRKRRGCSPNGSATPDYRCARSRCPSTGTMRWLSSAARCGRRTPTATAHPGQQRR